ncbi:MAG TPA: hypothetical protein VG757_03880 [Devosia sp.]|nr:hypothetical protein [Devosia sp.]
MSLRKARLAIALVDSYADRLYAAHPARAEDILIFRAQLSATSPPLALLLAFAEQKAGAPELRLETTPLSPSDYNRLSEAEYMVSLYNNATIPRLLLIAPDGSRHDVQQTLHDALETLRNLAWGDTDRTLQHRVIPPPRGEGSEA